MYLAAGAEYAVLMLPHEWTHKNGVRDLFQDARKKYDQALKYGMANPELYSRIMLMGFHQQHNGVTISEAFRNAAREECDSEFKKEHPTRQS
jgi:hypothetical protein